MKRWTSLFVLACVLCAASWADCIEVEEVASIFRSEPVSLDVDECAVLDTRGYRVLSVITEPASASGELTATDNFADADEFVVGEDTYIAEDGTVGAGEFELGADAEESLANLCALISSDHDDVTCTDSDDETLTVEARVGGSAGNTIATTTTSMTAAWGDTTLADVVDPVCTASPVVSAGATGHSFFTAAVTDTEPARNAIEVAGLFYFVSCSLGPGRVERIP